MADFEDIADSLRRQRRALEEQMDDTIARRGRTAELMTMVEDLRRRTEETQRRMTTGETQEPGPDPRRK